MANHSTLFHEEQRPIVKICNQNRPFYLGERVINLMWGKGVVIAVNWGDSRPLRVAFDEYPYKHREGYPQSLLYRPDGTRMLSDKQRLFHEEQAPTIEAAGADMVIARFGMFCHCKIPVSLLSGPIRPVDLTAL